MNLASWNRFFSWIFLVSLITWAITGGLLDLRRGIDILPFPETFFVTLNLLAFRFRAAAFLGIVASLALRAFQYLSDRSDVGP